MFEDKNQWCRDNANDWYMSGHDVKLISTAKSSIPSDNTKKIQKIDSWCKSESLIYTSCKMIMTTYKSLIGKYYKPVILPAVSVIISSICKFLTASQSFTTLTTCTTSATSFFELAVYFTPLFIFFCAAVVLKPTRNSDKDNAVGINFLQIILICLLFWI